MDSYLVSRNQLNPGSDMSVTVPVLLVGVATLETVARTNNKATK
ncbi:MAG: hypothetical protein ACTHKA_26055 [Anaerocolumna jejuensis]